MRRSRLRTWIVPLALAAGLAPAADNAVERGMRRAGGAIEHGIQATGRAVERGAKKVQKSGKKASDKVEDKVTPKK
jgi:hypothetical protein